ncbi:hypothetical protein AVEN_58694-1, partial [Araneus ventricosus]
MPATCYVTITETVSQLQSHRLKLIRGDGIGNYSDAFLTIIQDGEDTQTWPFTNQQSQTVSPILFRRLHNTFRDG